MGAIVVTQETSMGASQSVNQALGLFGEQIRRIDEFHEVAEGGEYLAKRSIEQYALERYKSLIGTGAMARGVAPELTVEITEENYEAIATSYVEVRTSGLGPIRESLSLVLIHAAFEILLSDLCEIVIGALPDEEVVKLHGKRTVELRKAHADPVAAVREIIIHETRFNLSLKKRVNHLIAAAKKGSASTCSAICSLYAIKVKDLTKIDLHRQRIMHKLELDQDYRALEDGARLILAARWLVHLTANCVCGMEYGFVGLNAASSGDLRLTLDVDENLRFAHESDVLAVLPRASVANKGSESV